MKPSPGPTRDVELTEVVSHNMLLGSEEGVRVPPVPMKVRDRLRSLLRRLLSPFKSLSQNRVPGSEQGGASSSGAAATNEGSGPNPEVTGTEVLRDPSSEQGGASSSRAASANEGSGPNLAVSSEQGGASSSGATVANEDSRTRYSDQEFRNKLRNVLVKMSQARPGDLSRDRDLLLFMAESDEYPRFAWPKFLLSFKFWEANAESDEWIKGNGPSLEVKLSRILREYPDILQRELLRDGLQWLNTTDWPRDRPGSRPDSYGALHAAVLWDSTRLSGTKLVNLLMEPDIDARAKIFEQLEPTDSNVSDPFHLMRRAVLWRYMRCSDDKYTKVAKFMSEIAKARQKGNRLRGLNKDLTSLITEFRLKNIDHTHVHPDPWVVILAWASVSDSDCKFILEAFTEAHRGSLNSILEILKQHREPSKFVVVLEKSSLYVQADIVSLLVRGTIPNKDEGEPSTAVHVERIDGNPSDRDDVMEKCFLDQFCERTPGLRWTPLHLAAARGNVAMVRALIESCDNCVNTLRDKRENVPAMEEKIVNSLYDDKHMTPLHYAVLGNKKDVLMALMNWRIFKPHVDDCDIFMRSAFQIACCSQERYDIAKHLHDNSDDSRSVDMDKENCCSFTSMHWAIYSGSKDIAEILIDRGVTFSKGGVAVVSIIREYGKKDTHVQQYLLNLPSIKSEMTRLYQDRQVFVDAANAILVGAALIASVTFGGWLAPPWGDHHDSKAIHVFWAFSSLSFFFSMATVMSGASSVLPYSHSDGNIKYAVENLRKWLLLTSSLLILSVALVLGAFASGGFSSLLGSSHLRTNMIITTSIGSFVCGTIGYKFCKRLISLTRPLWLDQKVKDILKLLDLKEMRSEIEQLCRGIFKQASPSPISDNGTGSHDLRIVLKNLHNIAGSAPKPPGNSDDKAHWERKLRKHWKSYHGREGTERSCCVRNCYMLLESTCSDDLSKLKGIETEDSMLQFQEMWSS